MGFAHAAPVCALLSGGLDSAALVLRLLGQGTRVHPLYVRCGLRWEPAELYWLRRFLRAARCRSLAPLEIVTLPVRSLYGPHWSLGGGAVPGPASRDQAVYLPGRNVLLLTAAALVCARRGLSRIALGLLRGNPFGDASPRFLAQLGRCLRLALGRPVRLVAPLRRLSKAQLIRAHRREPLGLTFSCLRPVGLRHCGRCNKCAERRRAFRLARVTDPTDYAAQRVLPPRTPMVRPRPVTLAAVLRAAAGIPRAASPAARRSP
jgi:7-cyano-7-deazaguanine synthase